MLTLRASTHAGNSSVAQSVMGGAKSSTRPVAYPATTSQGGTIPVRRPRLVTTKVKTAAIRMPNVPGSAPTIADVRRASALGTGCVPQDRSRKAPVTAAAVKSIASKSSPEPIKRCDEEPILKVSQPGPDDSDESEE